MYRWHKSISATKYGRITGEVRLRDRIADVYGDVMSYQGKPSSTQISRLANLKTDIEAMQEKLEIYENNDLKKLNKKLEKQNLSIISLSSQSDFDTKK